MSEQGKKLSFILIVELEQVSELKPKSERETLTHVINMSAGHVICSQLVYSSKVVQIHVIRDLSVSARFFQVVVFVVLIKRGCSKLTFYAQPITRSLQLVVIL